MFQELIIAEELSLDKFLSNLNFDLYLTMPQINHLKSIINTMMSDSFNSKIFQVAEANSSKHRSSINDLFLKAIGMNFF